MSHIGWCLNIESDLSLEKNGIWGQVCSALNFAVRPQREKLNTFNIYAYNKGTDKAVRMCRLFCTLICMCGM